MTPQQILELLKIDGIELICEQDNIKVRATKSKLTDTQISLISAHKSALLTHLKTPQDERNHGSQARNPKSHPVSSPDTPLAKEDFSALVTLFKTLLTMKRAKGIGTGDSFTTKQKSNKSEVA